MWVAALYACSGVLMEVMTAPLPLPPSPLPWQPTESVGSTVAEWRGRWRRALLGTSRLVCKYEPYLSPPLRCSTSERSEQCSIVCRTIAACFGLAACLCIDANVRNANLLANRCRDVNKSHVCRLLWASFAATYVSWQYNLLWAGSVLHGRAWGNCWHC